MMVIESSGNVWREWTQTTALRWIVPRSTTTERPLLQQKWVVAVYEDGKPMRQETEWRTVETVVVD